MSKKSRPGGRVKKEDIKARKGRRSVKQRTTKRQRRRAGF